MHMCMHISIFVPFSELGGVGRIKIFGALEALVEVLLLPAMVMVALANSYCYSCMYFGYHHSHLKMHQDCPNLKVDASHAYHHVVESH